MNSQYQNRSLTSFPNTDIENHSPHLIPQHWSVEICTASLRRNTQNTLYCRHFCSICAKKYRSLCIAYISTAFVQRNTHISYCRHLYSICKEIHTSRIADIFAASVRRNTYIWYCKHLYSICAKKYTHLVLHTSLHLYEEIHTTRIAEICTASVGRNTHILHCRHLYSIPAKKYTQLLVLSRFTEKG